MPRVGRKKFPYTAKGIAAARRYRKQRRKRIKNALNSKRRY